MLEIKNINISFQRNIFNNAKIQFYDSHIHAIIGKSGSGKTTFLRSMIQDFPQLQMEMVYNNQIINQKDDFVKEHIAYVDQLGSYFPNMSIKQHFSFYAQMKDEKIEESEIERFLNQVNLHHINIKKSPSVLSIGERKRFLIALALYCDKDIIILDEPTASLDKKNIILLKEVLLSLKNKMIILTTHTPEILEICDVIYKIENQQFEIEKQEIHDQNEMTDKVKKYHFSPIKYFQYKTPIQWIQFAGIIIISIFILIQSMPLTQSFMNTTEVDPLIFNQSSKEMIFMRNRSGQLDIIYAPAYEDEIIQPMNKDDLNKIQNMNGVRKIETFKVLTLFNPNSTDETQSMEIIDQNGHSSIYSVEAEGSRAPAIFPYYEENDFNAHDNGIYINSMLSEIYNIHEGDTIKAKFYIPYQQYVLDTNPYRKISYVLKELELKVDKVLNNDENYRSVATDFMIYVPDHMFRDMINSVNENDEMVPSSSVNRAADQVDAQPYTMDEYVIFVDEDQAKEVYDAILEMDSHYDAYSVYLSYLEIDEIQKDAFQTQLVSVAGICGIALAAFIVVQYFMMKSRKEEMNLLRRNGINKQKIHQVILFENGVYFVVVSVVGLILAYFYQSYLDDFTNMFVFNIIVLVISLFLLLVNVIVSQFLLKDKKHFKNRKL